MSLTVNGMNHVDLMTHFDGARLRRTRQRACLSRNTLARRCEQLGHSISSRHIARLEDGKHKPYDETAGVLARALNVAIDDLLVDVRVSDQ
jgi:transcriptional regulator with XRE-family HTH domain